MECFLNVGVHNEIARLVEQAGPGVLDDADSFRAALDDFLAEDAATRGELNLLVDAVRLGTFARLLSQVEHGAEITQATRLLGRELARDRGTTESTSAAWALGVLAFAVGKLDEADLTELRAAMVPVEGLAAQVVGRPVDAVADGGPLAATTVKRPATVPIEDELAQRPRRAGRTLLAVGAVVALLAGGIAFASGWGRGDDDPAVADRTSGTTTAPADFVPLTVNGGTDLDKGVRSERTYRMSADRVSSTVVLINTTKSAMTVLWTEVVPKELADHVGLVDFKPTDRKVLEADPVVYWRLALPAGGSRQVRWTTPLPEDAVPSADYLARITGWHEEAVTDALPLIRREVPDLARAGEVVPIPDIPEAEKADVVPVVPGAPETSIPFDQPTASTAASPRPTKAAANRAPRISLSSKSTGERVSGAYTVGGSDPDGDSWSIVSVSNPPPGIGRTGSHSLGGTVSHNAASVTTSKSNIRSRTYSVTVTIQDSHGLRDSGTFTWTVRDTHFAMPQLVGTCACAPDIAIRLNPSTAGCYSPSKPEGDVAKQSIGVDTPVAYGAGVLLTFVNRNSGDPNCP
ncbi:MULTISPECIES: Ig-like domain-containing protein [unclassified Nocardioides]|uniref:Ig-like domain-containing protein n=1 Tax=unclassified Nocardioides TaxID=2615069 RepID=UPI0006F4DFA0|nr:MULTISPECIES: hypothetical protein [unclassified Nocardioides]KRA29777.1 hypothetical protein ASD81_18835 [Nocardioides sp. Root614]KRA86701.1 hypothetical protein ASD84_21060 [Nocardioides sp. Root682]